MWCGPSAPISGASHYAIVNVLDRAPSWRHQRTSYIIAVKLSASRVIHKNKPRSEAWDTAADILGHVRTTNQRKHHHSQGQHTFRKNLSLVTRVSLRRPDLRRTFDFQNSSSPEVAKLKEERPERKAEPRTLVGLLSIEAASSCCSAAVVGVVRSVLCQFWSSCFVMKCLPVAALGRSVVI